MIKKEAFGVPLLLLMIVVSSCRKYENYYNEILIISDGTNKNVVLAHEGADDLSTYGYGGYYPNVVYSTGQKGDTLTAYIDWSEDYYNWLNPRSEEVFFYHFYQGQFVTETEKISSGFKIKPGIKFIFDMSTGEVINTKERSEKINNGDIQLGSGSCGDEVGSWTLDTYDGESLPAPLDDGVSEIISGRVTFYSDGTWSGTNTVEGNGTSQVNDSEGTYSCEGNEISLLNQNNQYTATVSLNGSSITWNDAAGYVLEFSK